MTTVAELAEYLATLPQNATVKVVHTFSRGFNGITGEYIDLVINDNSWFNEARNELEFGN